MTTVQEHQRALRELPYYKSMGGRNLLVTQSIHSFERLAETQEAIEKTHQRRPIDFLVGDDVSGRYPTLMTHRYLRLAQAAGHIDTVPETYFLASGRDDHVYGDTVTADLWQDNLRERAKAIIGKRVTPSVLIVTELMTSGSAVGRIRDAFEDNLAFVNWRVVSTPYTDTHTSPERRALGVEKSVPQATSHRHPYLRGRTVAQLRYFLHDLTEHLFMYNNGQPAPATQPFSRSANYKI